MEMWIKDLVEYLIENKLTISVAESLTGGLVCARLCEVPGVSKVLLEGIVSYTNESKMTRLNVNKTTLDKFTAVSLETAEEMAIGVRKNLNSDIGISVTGLAGPLEFDEFGNKKGTVFTAVSLNGKIFSYRFEFSGDRDSIRNQAAEQCLLKLFEILLGKGKI
ncbi:MAG: CinA family protein [Proteocatella sp.]